MNYCKLIVDFSCIFFPQTISPPPNQDLSPEILVLIDYSNFYFEQSSIWKERKWSFLDIYGGRHNSLMIWWLPGFITSNFSHTESDFNSEQIENKELLEQLAWSSVKLWLCKSSISSSWDFTRLHNKVTSWISSWMAWWAPLISSGLMRDRIFVLSNSTCFCLCTTSANRAYIHETLFLNSSQEGSCGKAIQKNIL